MRAIHTLAHLAAALKKKDIPWGEVRVGDIIASYPIIFRVDRIEELPEGGRGFYDSDDNGTLIEAKENLVDWKARIIPREFLAETPYE